MLTHIVVLTLIDSATADDRSRIAAGMAALPEAIPGLHEVVVREDVGLAADSADLAFLMTFSDEDSWRGYAAHPAHVLLAATVIRPLLKAKVALQHR